MVLGRAVLAGVMLAACGGGGSSVDAPPSTAWDARVVDAPTIDAPIVDAPKDDGAIDAPIIDAAVIDARPADARPIDGRPDAHLFDARPDARPPDAPPDAHRIPDAGPDATPDATPFTLGVSTLAGDADKGYVDGVRALVRFSNPVNVALGPDGKVYVADFDNGAIRRVNALGATDTVYTAAKFQRPFGLVFDAAGALYVSTDNDDTGGHSNLSGTIWKIDVTAKTAAVVVRGIGRPRGLAILPDGRLVLSDFLHHTIRLLEPTTHAITLIAGAYDVPGYVDGAGTDARFSTPYGVAVIAGPALIVADYDNHRLRRVELDGTTSTFAGDGTPGFGDGPALDAQFDHPVGVAADASSTVYVTDSDNFRVRRLSGGTVDTIAGSGTAGWLDSDDRLAAQLYGLEGVCTTADGATLYLADGNRGDDTLPYNRVRMVTMNP